MFPLEAAAHHRHLWGMGRGDDSLLDLGGKVLVAMPGMGDPRFARSVILICAHTPEGAMGLVVNHPAKDADFRELLEHLKIAATSERREVRVHVGGPVERGRGFVLHSGDYSGGSATMTIPGGLAMTATLDVLEALAQGRGPERALLALGYAGWGPGQLESEILRNDWIVAEAPEDLLFAADDGGKWAAVLRGAGIDPVSLSGAAGRA